MSLLSLNQVSLAFGASPLLDQANLTINNGDRLCLIGRNGAGKSSLLKILLQEQNPDDGEIVNAGNVKITAMAQELPEHLDVTVNEIVAQAFGKVSDLLSEYEAVTQTDHNPSRLHELQEQIDHLDGWSVANKVDRVLSMMALDGKKSLNQLSGGWQRRVLLARALVTEPDILLLDEPTNHLDIDAISWLEEYLASWQGTLVFVSHDRAFINRVSTHIVELDRGKLTTFPGDYKSYLEQKQKLLEEEEAQNKLFDKKLAQEEVWIRQGIKARRTRNEGRVRALKKLREERKARRERSGSAKMVLSEAERSGKLVYEIEKLDFTIADKKLVSGFSSRIMRGDKIALLGPNGIGKSTLIKLLLGQLKADTGNIKEGTKLEVAYFDQSREQLNDDMTVSDVVSGGRDFIETAQGKKHIYGYLQDFLFSPERSRGPVSILSGGEKNRLLLARLFSKSFNLLVMDEPTNDLDMETLELLEELLLDFSGTLLLVSHDREFVDSVATQSWVFEGDGKISEWIGGYSDWKAMSRSPSNQQIPEKSVKPETPKKPEQKTNTKLSYKIQREYDSLPSEIETLEKTLADLQEKANAPDFYQQDFSKTQPILDQLQITENQLEEKMERWLEIEDMLDQMGRK